jgi:hypothetical protein
VTDFHFSQRALSEVLSGERNQVIFGWLDAKDAET